MSDGFFLESYTLEPLQGGASAAVAFAAGPEPAPPFRLTIRGSGFIVAAVDPEVRVGDVVVEHFEILPDQRTLVAHLEQMPEEGAAISVSYGSAVRAVLPEPFSRSRLKPGPPDPVA